MKNIWLICLGLSLLFSCTSKRNENVDYDSFFLITKKDIPKHKKNTSFFYKAIRQNSKLLGYHLPDSSSDSLIIRIWYQRSFVAPQQVLTIAKSKKNVWSATLCSFDLKYSDTSNNVSLLKKRIKKMEPENGWNHLIKGLLDMQIMSLPDMFSIGLRPGPDGHSFGFEIQENANYRYYEYGDPEINSSEAWQKQNVVNILKLVAAQLDVKWLP